MALETAEEEPRGTDTLKRSSRRLRRRSDNTTESSQGTHSSSSESADKPKAVPKISISDKYLSGTYSEKINGTIYPFYNDLKIAFMHQIKEYQIGSKSYVSLSDIFKFTIDLILREGVRLSLLTPDEIIAQEEKAGSGSEVSEKTLADLEEEYEVEILKGFQKVYSDVVEQYGESFVVYTRDGPLFTSLDGKSSLDNRDTIPGQPHGAINGVSTTKIIPQISPLSSYQMAFISPIISSVPHPSIPPTVLLSGFTHPNAIPHPAPKWLQYEGTQSFAPSIDTSSSLLDKDLVNTLWYEKFSQRRMVAEKQMLDILRKKADAEDAEMPDAAEESKTDSAEKTPASNGDKEASEEAESGDESGIDFTQALLWSPTHFIDDDELEAAQNGTELELISDLILELQQVQSERLAKTDGTEFLVTLEERRLASKVQSLLARVLEQDNVTPQQLDLDLDPKYPVLQAVYQGTLPVPELHQPKYPGAIPGAAQGLIQNSGSGGKYRYTPVRKRR